MCGIAGKVSLREKIKPEEIGEMTRVLAHRGPDDAGVWTEANVGLGNTRLAIFDLSAKGHMPMISANGRFVITYNGEIYGFDRTRENLEKLGHRFRSGTDTEVVLALYERYGVKCLKKMQGMFALAIWDRREKTLFLARDRLGKKPLKYFWDGETFIFASELKAMLGQKEIKVKPDYTAIHHFLTLGYVPAPRTGFDGINKLEPGHYLLLDTKKKRLIKKRYWKLRFDRKLRLSEEEWIEKIRDTIEDAVRIRLAADVPVGAFLSGGVDSSTVVALMSRLADKRIKTFSIGFKEKRYDESRTAALVAKRFGTEHTTLMARPEAAENLADLVYQYEEPYADSSAVVTTMVSRLARQYVTVVLNGDGGDENFAGYGRYNKQRWYGLVPRIPWPKGKNFRLKLFNRLTKIMEKLGEDPALRYLRWVSYFSPEDKLWAYGDQFAHLPLEANTAAWMSSKLQESGVRDAVDQALSADITNYLPEDLLVKVDIASMSVGLEARSPLLDYRVVELAAKMPSRLKLKGASASKYIFKKAMVDILPREVLEKPKKGFSIPLEEWFGGRLGKYAQKILLERKSLKRGLLREEAIKHMLKYHQKTADFGPRLWATLCLELWFRRFID